MKFSSIIAWIFGILVFADGILNLFRGNDHTLGAAFMILSLIYFPPSYAYIKKRFGLSIHYILRMILAVLIFWISLAVGAIGEGYIF